MNDSKPDGAPLAHDPLTYSPEELKKWWPARCPACGWRGLSRDCHGGETLADTGDFNDVTCPKCETLVDDDADADISLPENTVAPGPQRQCGGCTMCCKLMAVPEINKVEGKWCDHARIGEGCALMGAGSTMISPERIGAIPRPQSCADFWCLWTLVGDLPEVMRPDRSKVVLSMTTDGKGVIAFVDPSRPDAFNTGSTGDYLLSLLHKGITLYVVNGEKRTMYQPQREEVQNEGVNIQ